MYIRLLHQSGRYGHVLTSFPPVLHSLALRSIEDQNFQKTAFFFPIQLSDLSLSVSLSLSVHSFIPTSILPNNIKSNTQPPPIPPHPSFSPPLRFLQHLLSLHYITHKPMVGRRELFLITVGSGGFTRAGRIGIGIGIGLEMRRIIIVQKKKKKKRNENERSGL